MKRNIFKALAVVAALALSSCSMFNTVEKDDNSTESKETYITIGLNQAARTALPTVKSENDFTSFTLTSKESIGSRLLGTWTSDDTSSAYAKMNAAKIAVTAGSTYTFTLQAVKGGAKWEGSVTKTIETGENSLSFTLAVASLSTEGTGAINVTLSVPSAVKAVEAWLYQADEQLGLPEDDENPTLTFADGKATYTRSDIEAGNYVLVYTLYGDTQKTLKLGEWREYAGIADGLTSSSNPVIASNDDLAHIYKITLNLNGGTFTGTFPGSYTRYSFDEDNEISLPYSAIRSDYIYLNEDGEVELYKKNCFFEGWYDAETDGEIVYCIEPSMGDVTLWAYWTDTLTLDCIDAVYKNRGINGLKHYLNLQTLLDKGFTQINLKLTGMADKTAPADDWTSVDWNAEETLSSYTDERFTAIFDAICAVQGDVTDKKDEQTARHVYTYTGLGIKLDLSETSLTYLPLFAFADIGYLSSDELESIKKPVNLTGITLPETLTALLSYTFLYPGFKEITIPKNVTYIYLAIGFTQGLTIDFESGSSIKTLNTIVGANDLVAINIPASVETINTKAFYKSGLEEITFEEGCHLQTIGDDAFYECNFTSITLPASLKEISYRAFSSCTKLTTINFEGTTAQWAAVERKKNWHLNVPATTVTCSDGVVGLDYPIGTKMPSEPKEVGDIVFNDGSATPYTAELRLTDAQKAAAVAVIFYAGTGEATSGSNENILGTKTLGVGIEKDLCKWAADDSVVGEKQNIEAIRYYKSETAPSEGIYYTHTYKNTILYITGDFDGSDNWNEICKIDSNASETPANYPAFNFANTYAARAESHVANTAFERDWYVPSYVELLIIHENFASVVKPAFKAATGNQFELTTYWSSSQYANYYEGVGEVDFTGSQDPANWQNKGSYSNVCAIREF